MSHRKPKMKAINGKLNRKRKKRLGEKETEGE